MNVCKRFSIILVSLGLFLSVIAITSIPVLATEIDAEGTVVAVEGLPQLPDTVKPGMSTSQLSNEQRQAIIDKALDFYFPSLTGYAKTCAQATLSAALKLYEEKKGGDINGLQYYLKSVALSIRSLVATSGSQSYMQFRSAGDVLLQLNSKLADTGIVDGVIDWDKFVSDSALTAVRKFIDPSSGEEKTEERPATSSDVSVTSDVFKEYVESANTNNAPKGKGLWKASYRTDNYIHSISATSLITLWGSSSGEPFSDELYITPFYTDYQGITYYSDYQFRLYYGDYILGDITDYALYTDVYKYIDCLGYVEQSNISGVALKGKSMDKPYTICLGLPFWQHNYKPFLDFGFYQTLSDYHSSTRYNPGKVDGGGFVELPSDAFQVLSPYGSSVFLQEIKSPFAEKYSDFYYYDSSGAVVSAPDRTDIDLGYICSTEMISRTYSDVDTTKIPDNYYVTITGDTIYDYSITNPETGQSDTINYYITNNYTLPENGGSGGSGSGGSGGTGGNVTVGGKIDVDGTVSVDVNVNVNGGAGGTSFDDVNTDPLDDYLNSALDESSGFRAFLGDFFSFLPVELLVLLGIGLSFVIIGRIMGR